MAKTEHLNRIGEVLEKKGMSQYRLSKDSGISYSLINGYCQNKSQPTLRQLKVIADKLKVSGKELINF